MKLNKLIFTVLLSCFFTATFAQECVFYFPTQVGVKKDRTYYDKKGKVTSYSSETVKSFTGDGKHSEAVVSYETRGAKKNDPVNNSEYKMICDNGKFMVDMSSYFDNSFYAATGGAKVEVKADNIEIPNNAKTGDKLSDGTATLTTVGGPIPMSFYMKIYNRVYEGTEQIKAPTGVTYDCIKVSFDIEMKVLFKINMKGKEWYAKNVGIVKTETYDKNGKLVGYSELTGLK